MEIEIREIDDNKLIRLRAKYLGIVTPLEAREMRKRLETLQSEMKPGATVAIDLGEIDYMNSSGLGVLVEMSSVFHKQGNKVVLFGIKDGVMKVIHLMGLDRVLAIARTEESVFKTPSADAKADTKSTGKDASADDLRLTE